MNKEFEESASECGLEHEWFPFCHFLSVLHIKYFYIEKKKVSFFFPLALNAPSFYRDIFACTCLIDRQLVQDPPREEKKIDLSPV